MADADVLLRVHVRGDVQLKRKREVDGQDLATKWPKFEAARPSPQFNWVTTRTTGEVRVEVEGEVSAFGEGRAVVLAHQR